MSVQSPSISRTRRVRPLMTAVAVGTVSALALSACSSSGSTHSSGGTSGGKTPTEALAAAVHNMSAGKATSFELSLTPDDAMIAAMSKDSSGSDAQVAKKLLGNGGIKIKFTVSADKPLKDLKAGESPNAEFDLQAGGTDYLDVRTVGGAVYLKANLPQIVALSGKPFPLADALSSGQLPPDFKAPLQALMDDKWVSISAADLKGLEQMAQSMGGGDLSATPSAPNTALAGIGAGLMNALTKDATVTDKGSGKYEISGKVKTIAQDILQAVSPAFSAVPGKSKAGLDKMKEGLNNIPDSENVTFDVWLKDGSVSELQVDLAQFAPAAKTGGGHLPLDAKFSQSAQPVSAPGDATQVDVKKLISEFGALGGAPKA